MASVDVSRIARVRQTAAMDVRQKLRWAFTRFLAQYEVPTPRRHRVQSSAKLQVRRRCPSGSAESGLGFGGARIEEQRAFPRTSVLKSPSSTRYWSSNA